MTLHWTVFRRHILTILRRRKVQCPLQREKLQTARYSPVYLVAENPLRDEMEARRNARTVRLLLA